MVEEELLHYGKDTFDLTKGSIVCTHEEIRIAWYKCNYPLFPSNLIDNLFISLHPIEFVEGINFNKEAIPTVILGFKFPM